MDTTPTTSSEFKTTDYKVTIPSEIYQKLLHYVDACPIEISGLGDIEFDPITDTFLLTEIYLFKQKCTSTTTKLDNDALDKFNFKRIKDGLTLPRFWWHSHASMGVFWSSTDEDCMKELKNNDYSISLVANHKHEMLCRIIQWKPFPVLVDDVPVQVDYSVPEIPARIKREVEEKVEETVVTTVVTRPTYQYPIVESKNGSRSDNDDRDEKNYDALAYPERGLQQMRLPHTFAKAVRKIKELHLQEEWSIGKQEWVFLEPNSNRVWIDEHGVAQAYVDLKFRD